LKAWARSFGASTFCSSFSSFMIISALGSDVLVDGVAEDVIVREWRNKSEGREVRSAWRTRPSEVTKQCLGWRGTCAVYQQRFEPSWSGPVSLGESSDVWCWIACVYPHFGTS
jgi:hypothetical protein